MAKVQAEPETVNEIPLTKLKLLEGFNPRRGESDVEGLAANIKSDGLLQNLVVARDWQEADGENYIVLAGARRLKALQLLAERGDILQDYQVRTHIVDVDGPDRRRLAMVENLQRESLHPLDETEAWLFLLENGMEVNDLAARTGLTARTIKRRLALTNLVPEAQEPFREGKFGLALAQALSLGTRKDQRSMLEGIEDDDDYRRMKPSWITRRMLEDKVLVSKAIFPLDQYTGTITTDLFRDEDHSFFDDAKQFLDLQMAEVERKAEEYRAAENVEWVEIIGINEWFQSWQYEQARKNAKKYGVVIDIHSNGKVEIRERLKKRKMPESTTSSLGGGGGDRPKPPKPTYQPKLALEIGRHKTLSVQSTLLKNPRKAKEVAALRLLVGWQNHRKMSHGAVNFHGYLNNAIEQARDGESSPNVPDAYQELETVALELANTLVPENTAEDGGLRALSRLHHASRIGDTWINTHNDQMHIEIYGRIKKLDDATLDRLLLFLPILTFGEDTFEAIDSRTSIFNTVAQDLGVDMKQHWRPDRTFLDMRTVPQLKAIAQESGALQVLGDIGNKKKDIVNSLEDYFANYEDDEAREWLPGAMQFPAVDEAVAAKARSR